MKIIEKKLKKVNELLEVKESTNLVKKTTGFDKDLLLEKKLVLRDIRNLIKPEKKENDVSIFTRANISLFSSAFLGATAYYVGFQNTSALTVCSIGTLLFLGKSISEYSDHFSEKRNKNVYNILSKFKKGEKIELNKLDKMYNSEYKDVVLLMASMRSVEARKIRYKNFLKNK
jgi:hypothetical protein